MASEGFRVLRLHGWTRLLHGRYVILKYADDDISTRNCLLVALTDTGILSGKQAGPVFGLRPEQVSRLRSEYRRSGPSGLAAKRAGRPAALSAEQVLQARVLAGRRLTHAGIARRLGVPRSVVTETLKRHGGPLGEDGPARPEPVRNGSHAHGVGGSHALEPPALPRADQRLPHGIYRTPFAGTMLLHAYTHHFGLNQFVTEAGASAAGDDPSIDVTGLLVGLGVTAVLQDRLDGGLWPDFERQAGPLVGWERLPCPATLRRHLTRLTDHLDPVPMLGSYLRNVTSVGPEVSTVSYAGDLLPFGVADRAHLTARRGLDRATTMVGFDFGGTHPRLFGQLRETGVHWITYRHPPLRPSRHQPAEHTITRFGHLMRLSWTDEVETGGDGASATAYRQITVYDADVPTLQVLTSDRVTGADTLLREVIDRWAAVDHGPGRPAATPAPALVNGALAANGTSRRPGHPAAAVNGNGTAVPANGDNRPGAVPAEVRSIRRTTRQTLLALLERTAANAELWLAHRLHAATGDRDASWRLAVALLRGMEGTVAYDPAGIVVTLARPLHTPDAEALGMLLSQLNTDPARIPGDARPITYVLAT